MNLTDAIDQNTRADDTVYPSGVPSTFSWYGGATAGSLPPASYGAVTGWGQIYSEAGAAAGVNASAQIQIEDFTTFVLLQTGQWVEAQSQSSDPVVGAHYLADYSNNTSVPWTETTAAGVVTADAPANGYNDHFFPETLAAFTPGTVVGVFVEAQMRTTSESAELVANLGADWWANANAVYPNVTGAVASNWELLTTQWQQFYATGLTAAQLEANPPPGYTGYVIAAAYASGAENSVVYRFAIARTGNTTDATTLTYSLVGSGSNPVPIAAFASTSGSLSFSAGAATETVSISVHPSVAAANQQFTFNLDGETGQNVSTGSAVVNLGITNAPYATSIRLYSGNQLTTQYFWRTDNSLYEVIDFGIAGEPYTSAAYLYNTSNQLIEDVLRRPDNSRYEVAAFGISGEPYTAAAYLYNTSDQLTEDILRRPDDTLYEVAKFAITGEPYTAAAYLYNSSSQLTEEIFRRADNALDEVAEFGVAGHPYTAAEYLYTTSSQLTEEIFRRADGSLDEVADFGIAGQPYTAADYLYSTSNRLTEEILRRADSTLYEVAAFGIASEPYTTAAYLYNTGGRLTEEILRRADSTLYEVAEFGIAGQPYTTAEYLYNASNQLTEEIFRRTNGSLYEVADFGIAGQPYTNADYLYNASNQLTEDIFRRADGSLYEVAYFGIVNQPYTSAEYLYNTSNQQTAVLFRRGDGALYEVAQFGIDNEPYVAAEYDYDTTGRLTTETLRRANNSVYAIVSFNADASKSILYEGITGQSYGSYQNNYNASGVMTESIFNNTDGSHTIMPRTGGVTLSSTPDGKDTFAFSKGFGQATLADFSSHLTGAGHDTVSLPQADFASFNQFVAAANFSGGNAIFTAANHDQLTIDGMSQAMLTASSADFKFVWMT